MKPANETRERHTANNVTLWLARGDENRSYFFPDGPEAVLYRSIGGRSWTIRAAAEKVTEALYIALDEGFVPRPGILTESGVDVVLPEREEVNASSNPMINLNECKGETR